MHESLILGLNKSAETRIVSIPAASTEVAKRDRHRVVLTFYPPSSGEIFLQPEGAAVLDQGIRLAKGDSPLTLFLERHGEIVRQSWQAIGRGEVNGSRTNWVETAEATNLLATATHAAVAGTVHTVVSVITGYATLNIIGDVNLLVNGASVAKWSEAFIVPQPIPVTGFSAPAGQSIGASIAAGGAGVVGRVNVFGFSEVVSGVLGTFAVEESQFDGLNELSNRG